MKLWLLRPLEKDTGSSELDWEWGPWSPWFDKYFGFVVRATSEESARELAANEARDEGRMAWLSSEYSSCIELLPEGNPEMIIGDYYAA